MKQALSSKRLWIVLAAILILLISDVSGAAISQETLDRVLGMLALLAGLDGWKPLGGDR